MLESLYIFKDFYLLFQEESPIYVEDTDEKQAFIGDDFKKTNSIYAMVTDIANPQESLLEADSRLAPLVMFVKLRIRVDTLSLPHFLFV